MLWGGVIGLFALIPLVRRTTPTSLLSTRWSILRSLLGGFGLALAFLLIAGLMRGMMRWTGLAIGVGSDTVRSMQGIDRAYGPLVMVGFVALLIPLVEEFVFRGVLLRASARHVALWAAVVIQALAFALWHEEPTDYPVMFVFALATAWLALRSGGLLAPVTFHATVNVLAAIQVLFVGRMLNQAV
jgi:membrane protease YdiL (CAAX protease family)